MRDSLDHWLTTPPEEMENDEEVKAAEKYANGRHEERSPEWTIAREAFFAGIQWVLDESE
jgi:hypothetical protein